MRDSASRRKRMRRRRLLRIERNERLSLQREGDEEEEVSEDGEE
jgi:hypothetical protein